MQSMIEELYYGGVQLDIRYYGKDSPFVRTAKKKAESYDKLMASLNDAEKELFEQFCEAQADIEDIARYDIYTETLRFGIRLMAEVFMSTDGWSAGRGWLWRTKEQNQKMSDFMTRGMSSGLYLAKRHSRRENMERTKEIPKVFWKYFDLYRREQIGIEEFSKMSGLPVELIKSCYDEDDNVRNAKAKQTKNL